MNPVIEKLISNLNTEIKDLERELAVRREAVELLKDRFAPRTNTEFEAHLSLRASKALECADITTLEELKAFVIKGGNLLKLKNFGRRSIREVERYLLDIASNDDELQPFFEWCRGL